MAWKCASVIQVYIHVSTNFTPVNSNIMTLIYHVVISSLLCHHMRENSHMVHLFPVWGSGQPFGVGRIHGGLIAKVYIEGYVQMADAKRVRLEEVVRPTTTVVLG